MALGFLSGQPRLMLNAADLAATGLIQPGSRVRYSLQIAGETAAVDAYRAWAAPRLAAGQRMEGVRDARPEIRSALDRAERFLNLAVLTTVLLAAAAVALAARRYLQRHLDGCAMMRCLGAGQALILRLHAMHFAILGLAAAACGSAIGVATQMVLALLAVRGVRGAAAGAGRRCRRWRARPSGLLLLLGFALPPLVSLARVPTLRVIRRELGAAGRRWGARLRGGRCGRLHADPVAGPGLQAGLHRARLVDRGDSGCRARSRGSCCARSRLLRGPGVAWRFGVAGLRRQRLGTVIQVVALALGIMALLTLDADPHRAPAQLAAEPAAGRAQPLHHQHPARPGRAPARVLRRERHRGAGPVSDGARPAREDQRAAACPETTMPRTGRGGSSTASSTCRGRRASRRATRSWRDAGGSGDGARASDELSVERGLAESLGLKLGDRLTFDIGGTPVAGTITSLRSVDWDSFNVNFFVLAPPGLFDGYPATYVTSFHLPRAAGRTAQRAREALPEHRADRRGAGARAGAGDDGPGRRAPCSSCSCSRSSPGLAVLYAAIASTQDERLYEAAIMRTLGASRAQINRAHLAEFTIIGAAAGFVAAAGATGLGWFVAVRFLQLEYVPDPAVWLIGILGGAGGVALAGYIGTRRVLVVAPLKVLRSLA